MRGNATTPGALEKSDIQGLVVSSFKHLPCAAYRLLRVTDARRAQAWLSALAPQVTTAERKQDGWSLNVAFTATGLAALGLSPDGLRTFPTAFQDGMASPRRSLILGDTESNEPARWRWGGPAEPVHVLILHYAETDEALKRHWAGLGASVESGVVEVRTLDAGRQPDSREHFGFADGVGQPAVAGSGAAERQKRRTGHVTELPAGEFVLGYADDYKEPSLSPTVAAADDPSGHLRGAQTQPGRRDLGLNGSYVVFRQLEQNVPAFWQFVHESAHAHWPGDPAAPVRLASRFVGRWPSGAPLVTYPSRDPHEGTDELSAENTFEYAGDAYGLACPIGAHIRRANPRDALGPDPEAARRSANRHRLLRRGRAYGDRIPRPWTRQNLRDDAERGLHFICLNGDIERQFEFVQQTWINNTVFAGLPDQVDPLIGNQTACSGMFTVQDEPLRSRIHNLRQVVTVRGGAYFFLPGIRAVRFLGSRSGA